MGAVGFGACSEEGVVRAGVGGWGDVAAGGIIVSCVALSDSPSLFSFLFLFLIFFFLRLDKRNVPSPPRRQHRTAGPLPGYQQRVFRHGTAPSESGPAHIVGRNHLDDGIVGGVALGIVRDGYAECDAAAVGSVELEGGREGQACFGIVDGVGGSYLRSEFPDRVTRIIKGMMTCLFVTTPQLALGQVFVAL